MRTEFSSLGQNKFMGATSQMGVPLGTCRYGLSHLGWQSLLHKTKLNYGTLLPPPKKKMFQKSDFKKYLGMGHVLISCQSLGWILSLLSRFNLVA